MKITKIELHPGNTFGGIIASPDVDPPPPPPPGNTIPVFTSFSPPDGTEDLFFSYTFVASGTPTPTYSVVSGSLPTGFSLSSGGVLSGTTTTPSTYNFTVRAINVAGFDDVAVDIIIAAGEEGSFDPPMRGGFFSILAVGAALPGGMTAAGADAAAAAAVNYSTWEPRPSNTVANHTTVTNTLDEDTPDFDATWNSTYLPRVSGNFEGTTDEIIQWASYKWGWSDELVRAEAVQESDWFQSAVGDFEPASNGHRVYDRTDDPSPTSFSMMQCKWYYHPPTTQYNGTVTSSSDPGSSYPKVMNSTALALDYFLCILRGIYDGHSTYLNGGGMAASGDEWGAIGSWFSGDWHDAGANSYIALVQGHLASKPWLDPGFPE